MYCFRLVQSLPPGEFRERERADEKLESLMLMYFGKPYCFGRFCNLEML